MQGGEVSGGDLVQAGENGGDIGGCSGGEE